MTQFARPMPAAAGYDSTIIGALELSEKKWVLAVQLPGVKRHSRHVVEARGDELAAFVERLKARCAVAGHNIKRVILTHEAGRDGFWLRTSAAGRLPFRHRHPGRVFESRTLGVTHIDHTPKCRGGRALRNPGQLRARPRLTLRPYDTKCRIK